MNLLFSIDDGYVEPLLTTIYSIRVNNPAEHFDIYILQKQSLKSNPKIERFCHHLNMTYHPLVIDDHLFEDAPVLKHWNETIYYRLLAHRYLPEHLDRVLYLDADILCINSLKEFYTIDFEENYYIAASHGRIVQGTREFFNRMRLQNPKIDQYVNTGVLLMNLPLIRQNVAEEDIFNFIDNNRAILFLPDQDVINGLYGEHIGLVPDELYNFDVRYPIIYNLFTDGRMTLDDVMEQTVFLHYCGKKKPWSPESTDLFTPIYMHYHVKQKRVCQQIECCH